MYLPTYLLTYNSLVYSKQTWPIHSARWIPFSRSFKINHTSTVHISGRATAISGSADIMYPQGVIKGWGGMPISLWRLFRPLKERVFYLDLSDGKPKTHHSSFLCLSVHVSHFVKGAHPSHTDQAFRILPFSLDQGPLHTGKPNGDFNSDP